MANSHSPVRRGRPPVISRDEVAAAAVGVGFEALTVVAVAERLGVSHAGLYTYVADRDDLVVAAVDLVVDRIEWPEPSGHWRPDLEGEAWAIWNAVQHHPGISQAVARLRRAPPRLAERFAQTCHHLVGAGASPELALVVADTVYHAAVDASAAAVALADTSDDARRDLGEAWVEPMDRELADQMRAAITGDPAAWFARRLTLILDGATSQLG